MLTAKLILERLDKDYRLLERREQPSRSFVKGFIEFLYLSHAYIQNHSYNMVDIDGFTVGMDDEADTSLKTRKSNLKVGSPGGLSEVVAWHFYAYEPTGHIRAEEIGIQVGKGNTAPTPTDNEIETKIYHGREYDAAPAMYEHCNIGDDGDGPHDIYGNYQQAHSFYTSHAHRITSVKLKLYKTGTPGTITVAIQGWDATGKPDGVDLCTGTTDGDTLPTGSPYEWREITFGTPALLKPYRRYFIILRGGVDAANCVTWRSITSEVYQRGDYYYSSNGGGTWSTGSYSNHDHMFEEWGQSDGELEYGGCELINLSISDPNGEFTIRRYFTNHCGNTITIEEVGIYAAGESDENKAYSFLIARDVVSPIEVADGQILRVTYVPQITV